MKELIKLEIKERLAVIKLINAKKMNAINDEVLKQLDKQIEKASKADLSCLFIKGSDGVFSAGGDLNFMSEMNKQEAENASLFIQKIMSKIETLPCLTVSVVQGAAYGGGLELALSCDICIAEEDAYFALPELKFGIIPAGGGTVRALEKLNYSKMMKYLFSYNSINASTALKDGLIEEVIQKNSSEQYISEFNNKINKVSSGIIKKIKSHIKENQRKLMDNKRDNCFKREASLFAELLSDGGGKKMQDFLEQNKKSND